MSWLQVRLALTPAQAETYEDLMLELGAVSVTFMDAEDQPIFEPDLGTTPLWSQTHLLALFEGDTDAEALEQRVQLLANGLVYEVERLEDQEWERSWMDNFQPMRFGQRLWIVPSWHEAPEPAAVNLLLDPGLAFGTGTHPTTSLCLQWLDGEPVEGRQVLDFGCGSPLPPCCWAPSARWAPTLMSRPWKPRGRMPTAMASTRRVFLFISPPTCQASRPTWWWPTSSPAHWSAWPSRSPA